MDKKYIILIVIVIAAVILISSLIYVLDFYFASYTYVSDFQHGNLGLLCPGGFMYDPSKISGTTSIENGMLKIVSDNCYQMQLGINWSTLDYRDGYLDYPSKGWYPWLGVYYHYHCEVTFVKPSGITEVPELVVENWIAPSNGYSYTCMVIYSHGILSYSYGSYPLQGASQIVLGNFSLSSQWTVVIDANYNTHRYYINYDGHIFSDLPAQIEVVGTEPKPFGQFAISLYEPMTIYVKSLKVSLSDQLTW